MRKYGDSVTSATTGLPVYLAEIRVLKADGAPASVFSDNGVTPLAQPVLTDGLGLFSFYVADGTYTLVIAAPGGANPVTTPGIEIYEDARNVSVPIGEAGLVLPSVGARSGALLAFDSAGLPIAVPAYTGDPVAAVVDEAILRADGDATEMARATTAEADLDDRVSVTETEIDALQGTITSGRREYATYASAVSDAATPVLYPAVALGSVAEVPTTDAGSHTDPVVGGTVANTGIFRWSVSPAGWQRISDTAAASAAPYATAAAASAASAASSEANAAASASKPPLLAANLMGYQRTVAPVDLGNGYGAPTVAPNGQVTFAGGGAIKGFLYYLVGPGLVQRDAGLSFTARVPIVSGAPASARLIQFNAANTEVGTRPTAAINSTEIGFHGVVLNAATVKLRLEITSGGSALVTTFMAVSLGEPATVIADGLYNEAEGYLHEQLNEIPLVVPTYTFSENGTGGTFVGGVLAQGANAGAASGLQTNSPSFVVGGKYRVRFRVNSRLLQASPSFAYTGDINAFNQTTFVAKITEIPGDTSHVFYELAFIIPPHPTQPTYPLRALTIGFYSPVEAVVCDDFIFATDYQFPLVRTPPLAVRTYISNAIATALAAGGTTLQVPTAAVDLWGDSLIDFNHSAGSVSDALATLLGGSIPVQNFGVATQNALEIAMRAGGTPVLLSLVGDAIPATTTAVAISNFNAYASPTTAGSNSTNGTDPLYGTLGGIPGRLDSVRSGGTVIGLTFTRTTAGSAVPINRNAPFLPMQGEATRSKHQVLVWGENDVGGTGGTVTGNFIADLYDRQVRAMLPVDKRFLVGSVLHSNHGVSSEVINDINLAVAARFSRYVVDLTSAPTAEEMATLGFSPTADDLTDMDAVVVATVSGTTLTINSVTSGTVAQWKYLDPQAFRGNYVINSGSGTSWTLNAAPGNFSSQTITLKGWIPRGMRSGGYSGGAGVLGGDQLHLNTIGNQLWALRLYRAFKQRGWF